MYTILLVDDRDETCEAYATLLHHFGYRAVCAKNGHEACRLARDLLPDLIVMDLNMPVLDGWSAAQVLKADPTTAKIPIVALSAYAYPQEIDPRHARCGFEAVLVKPLPPSRLLEEAERRLGSTRAA